MRPPLNCQQSIRKQKGAAARPFENGLNVSGGRQEGSKGPADKKAAAAPESGREGLKTDFRGNLQAARPAASQKGIADAHVGTDTILRGVRDKRWQIRIREVGVVEQVVGFKAQL
jgi:hypothetical protein